MTLASQTTTSSISHLITSLPGWGLVVLGLVMGALPMSPHGDETSVKIIYYYYYTGESRLQWSQY
jgi:hypothetical protein